METGFRFDYDADCEQPYEFVELPRNGSARPVPEPFRDRILIDTVHDGEHIPRRFLYDRRGEPRVEPELLDVAFCEDRDWGAGLIARKLASALGLGGYGQVRIARVLLDFNRFPGSTPPNNNDFLKRLAINAPFRDVLEHREKIALLEGVYDRISEQMEPLVSGRLIKIGIHTYDEHNPSRTERPEVSLITQPAAYQRTSVMPYGLFDPLFPDILGETTCSRVLRDRISLNLERSGFRVGHNHPYPMPEGSVEVRSQVWYFFAYLRQAFEEVFPATRDDQAYQMVWTMLLNTNLRLSEGEALRGYLHRYRRVPQGDQARYQAAERAYSAVRSFIEETEVVQAYRQSRSRPSSLVIEVRKDLIYSFDRKGWPTGPKEDAAEVIAKVIAEAIAIYFETDREIPSVW